MYIVSGYQYPLSLMCVSALIFSRGITFQFAGLAGVVMRGRYTGLTLPN